MRPRLLRRGRISWVIVVEGPVDGASGQPTRETIKVRGDRTWAERRLKEVQDARNRAYYRRLTGRKRANGTGSGPGEDSRGSKGSSESDVPRVRTAIAGRPRLDHRPGFRESFATVLPRLRSGEMSQGQAARELGISVRSLKRYVEKARVP